MIVFIVRIAESAASNPLGATSVPGFAPRAAVAASRNDPYHAVSATLASVAYPLSLALTGYSW